MRRDVQLWTAVLTGPTAWFVCLLANFALAPWTCTQFGRSPLFAVAAVALLLSAVAGIAAWRLWRQIGVQPPGESGGVIAYQRSLALAGVLLSGVFVMVIVAQSIPNLMLEGCE
jgi:hypothetical protein